MSLIPTRIRGNDTRLPAVLPSLHAALSRRRAIFGAVTVAGATVAAAPIRPEALSANDTRILELVDAYAAVEAEIEATPSTAPHFPALVGRYCPIEDEVAATPADSLQGVVAKARLYQRPSVRGCLGPVPESIADDVWRLFGGPNSAAVAQA